MDAAFFFRILIALVCVLAILALLVPLSTLVGFPITGNLLTVIRICVVAIGTLYVLRS